MLKLFGLILFGLAAMSMLTFCALHMSSLSSDTSEDDASRARHAVDGWLRLHPPRQASHDAEMLRRRILESLVELEPAELAQHVPAIAASLDHDDTHVRGLARAMLSRLEPQAVAQHSVDIAARLAADAP